MAADMTIPGQAEFCGLETARLHIRALTLADANFIHELLTEPAFLRFIGDRGVHSLETARDYLSRGPLLSYTRFGFGLWLVALKQSAPTKNRDYSAAKLPSGEAIGICGLIKRETFADVDIGYAFLQRWWGKGYASEAAQAVKDYGLKVLQLGRLIAVTNQDNAGSIRVLEKIGMRYEGLIRMAENEPELKLFGVNG